MTILLGFLPYLVNALLTYVVEPQWALLAAGTVALLQVLHQRFVQRRSYKINEVGSTVMFFGLAAAVAFVPRAWQQAELRLLVDIGLVLIVVLSLALRRPFTLQYAIEQVPPEVAKLPLFRTINVHITVVWLLAFVVMAAANAAMLQGLPGVPGAVLIAAAMTGATGFTRRYPRWCRDRLSRRG